MGARPSLGCVAHAAGHCAGHGGCHHDYPAFAKSLVLGEIDQEPIFPFPVRRDAVEEERIRRVLADVRASPSSTSTRGDRRARFTLSEPEAGFDAYNIRSRAMVRARTLRARIGMIDDRADDARALGSRDLTRLLRHAPPGGVLSIYVNADSGTDPGLRGAAIDIRNRLSELERNIESEGPPERAGALSDRLRRLAPEIERITNPRARPRARPVRVGRRRLKLSIAVVVAVPVR